MLLGYEVISEALIILSKKATAQQDAVVGQQQHAGKGHLSKQMVLTGFDRCPS